MAEGEGEQLAAVSGTIEIGANLSPLERELNDLAKTMADVEKKIDKSSNEVEKDLDDLAKKSAALKGAGRNLTAFGEGATAGLSKTKAATFEARRELAAYNAELRKQIIRQQSRSDVKTIGGRAAAFSQGQEDRRETDRLQQEQKRLTQVEKTENRIREMDFQETERRKTLLLASEVRQRERIQKQLLFSGGGSRSQQVNSMSAVWQGAMNASIRNSNQWYVQQQLQSGAMVPQQSRSQALFGAVNQAIFRSNAAYLGSQQGGGAAPPGGGRGGSSVMGSFLGPGGLGSRIVGGLRGGLGLGLGAYGAVQGGRAIIEATQLATAYDRQEVAARRLAGGQEQLNKLMEAYEKATGGAVSQATALENVTRLQATGFAENAEQIKRFVQGTRGASIALGKPQEYIIQETQLAVSNTSQKRLDQIGLSIKEVNDRIEELRTNNSALTREMAFQEAVIGLLNEKYGTLADTLEGQATALEKFNKAWADFNLALGQSLQSETSGVFAPLTGFIQFLTKQLEDGEKRAKVIAREQINLLALFNQMAFGVDPTLAKAKGLQYITQPTLLPSAANQLNRATTPGPRFNEDQMAVAREFRERELALEQQYNDAIIQEVTQYGEQRASTIRNYEKQIVREAEDFGRQRARAERDYQKSIRDAIDDAARRDVEFTEDYNRRIEDAREDSAERLQEIEEKFAEDREKSVRDHRDRLLSAAGSLDAIAVLEERKRWRREQEERNKGHQKAVEENREQLEETLADAREAYEERLEDAHRADEERLQDMREARAQQIADEDEDRAIQKARREEDYQDQLDELDAQHVKRIQQINDQAAKEREQFEKDREQAFKDADIFVAGLEKKFEALDKLTIDWLDMVRDKMEADIKEEKKRQALGSPLKERYEKFVGGFASGGPVRSSGLASVHAGEFVLSRDMLIGRVPIPDSVSTMMSANNSRTINLGGITIQTTPGMEHLVGDLVENKFIELLERVQ